MKIYIFFIFVLSSVFTSGCSLFSSGFETEISRPFILKEYDMALIQGYKFLGDDGVCKLFNLYGIRTERAATPAEPLPPRAILVSVKKEYGFIFPPTFFHNPFDPYFNEINFFELKINDRKGPIAAILYHRGIFGTSSNFAPLGIRSQKEIDYYDLREEPPPESMIRELEKIILSNGKTGKL